MYHSKPRDLEKAAAEAHDSWLIKRNQTEASDGLRQDGPIVIDAHRAQKRTAAMQKAREAATTVLAKKKARTTVTLARAGAICSDNMIGQEVGCACRGGTQAGRCVAVDGVPGVAEALALQIW